MVIWGSTFVVTKTALDEIPPLLLALLRFAVALAILIPLTQARGGLALLPRPLPLWTLFLMGVSGVTLYFVAFNLSLVYTTAGLAALIQGSIPAVTAAMAILFLREAFRRHRVAGIGISILGVALVVLVGAPAGHAPDPLLGNLLMVAAVLCWSAYTILGKSLDHTPYLAVTTYSMLIGALLLVPLALYDLIVQPPVEVSAGSWLAVLYLGVGASAASYLIWNWALRPLEASQVAVFINLIPVVGVAAAAIFLGEALLPGQLVGGALVLFGVWLAARE